MTKQNANQNANNTNASNPKNTEAAPDKMHVQILLDRSGSMETIAAATIDGLNGFLAKQRAVPGICRLSLADFDSREPFRLIADAIPMAEMRDLGPNDFQPRGGTPLFDALGLAIERCTARAKSDPVEDQILVIVTDGAENASTDFTGPEIAKKLKKRQTKGWTVLYLGANQDSFAVGSDLNLSAGNVANFVATDAGVQSAFDVVDAALVTHRSRTRTERIERKDDLLGNNGRAL